MTQMMMPTRPSASFIMIQTDLPFAFFQGRFHRPAQPTDADEFTDRTGGGRIAEIELDLRLGAQRTLEDEPDAWTGQGVSNGGHPQKSEFSHQGSLAAFLDHLTDPLQFRTVGEQVADLLRAGRRPGDPRMETGRAQQATTRWFDRRRAQPPPCVGGHFHEGPFTQTLNFLEKIKVFSVARIRCHPLKWARVAFEPT